jgi:hypothetical protein
MDLLPEGIATIWICVPRMPKLALQDLQIKEMKGNLGSEASNIGHKTTCLRL